MSRRRHRAGFGKALLLALAGLCLSCPPWTDPPPEIEYARCSDVYLPGPVCVLYPDHKISVWVKAEPGAVEIRAGGQPPKADVKEVSGGQRYRLEVPEKATSLVVSLRSPDGSRQGTSWSLLLADMDELPAWEEEVDALNQSGKREEARKRLIELLLPRKVHPKERGLIWEKLALMARADFNDREAETCFKRGILADHAAGCWTCEVKKTAGLALLYLDEGRFTDARRTLKTLETLTVDPMAPVESKFRAGFYNSILASRVGDYRSALEQLQETVELLKKVWRPDLRWKAEQALANLFQDLGRSPEASKLFERLQKESFPETPCDLGDFLTNRAWSWLQEREGGEESEDPAPMLKEAQAIYDGDATCSSQQRLNARLNLALAHQQAGRWREAGESLEQAGRLIRKANLREHLWWLDLQGRQAVAEGDPVRALSLYKELEDLAGRAQSFEGQFRAAFGRARVQRRLGHREEALQALAEADRLVDLEAWHVPAHEGRDTLVAQRKAATKLYLELLLDEGDREAAFNLARRARSRLLRQLTVRDRLAQLNSADRDRWEAALARYQEARGTIDQKISEEWQIPQNQRQPARDSLKRELDRAQENLDRAVANLGLPGTGGSGSLARPRPDEVLLVYHPLPKGWVGFAADERGIEVSRFDWSEDLTPEAQASLLLEPFHSALARAQSVRVLPYGPLLSVDFHVLPFEGEGEPLLARHLVIYGLDLPVRPEPVPRGERIALLVADPGGDLPAARVEAKEVAKAIRAWGRDWTLETIDREDAQGGTVLKALPRASLFHYAGHGTFAGFAGWDSVLKLAGGTSLTLSDLRTLHQAPAWVVLSSCDAGRSSTEAPGEGIGLAHAFLLAGSQAVVAATSSVDDKISRDLVMELYGEWDGVEDLPHRFQRAQQACLQRHPAGDGCESFRLLEP